MDKFLNKHFITRNMYKGLDRTIVQQVRFYTRKLKSQPGFESEDIGDLEQELMLEVISAISKFNPDRGCFATFVSSVLKRKVGNMTKLKKQKKRSQGYIFVPLDNDIPDNRYSADSPNIVADIEVAVDKMPAKFKNLCEALKHNNVRDTAEILGKSKTYVYARMKVLELVLKRLKCYLEPGKFRSSKNKSTNNCDFKEGEK